MSQSGHGRYGEDMTDRREQPLDLQRFQNIPEDEGLSLEELSTAYAELLHRGKTPYDEPEKDAAGDESLPEPATGAAQADESCDLTPKSILEAVLFVGNAGNQPLTSTHLASLMRGVRPQEIDELVLELNREYAGEGRPYRIQSLGAGYSVKLNPQYASLSDIYYGRVKEARLTQSTIDVLAIVAYRQPIGREAVDQIRGKPSGGILAQLLRRGLLRLDRTAGQGKMHAYRTTDRFLKLFGLDSLAELPQSQEGPPGGDE
jgi:segregation and condensation protein B